MIGFITGMPRCRTAWFAAYFDRLPGVCAYHEVLNGMKSKEDFYQAMERDNYDHVINSDSGLFITDFQERWPDAKTVIVHRDPALVFASLSRYLEEQGFPAPSQDFLAEQAEAINSLEGLHVNFNEITERLQEIHEYLVDVPFDSKYAEIMNQANIQLDHLTVDIDSYLLWTDFNKRTA